jgi:membrane protease YdiL (CAAX protease family)
MNFSCLRPLTRQDRQFLRVFAAYCLLGLVSNTVRTSQSAPPSLQNGVAIVMLLTVLALGAYVAEGVRTRRYGGEDLGLTLDSARAIALALLAAAYAVFAVLRVPSPGLERPVTLVLPVVGVLVEEVLFRPLLIRALQRAFAARRRPLLWAVVGAAFLWAMVHLPSYPLTMVMGGGHFLGGLLFGALYAFSGSNVIGFVVHVSANAGGVGSAVVFALYLLFAVLLRKRSLQGEATASPYNFNP